MFHSCLNSIMPKAKLFDDTADSNKCDETEQLNLEVNEEFAKKYDKWRAGEELQKLKDKYGEDAELSDHEEGTETDSESSSSSDEEPELLANDKGFLRTLALIKAKDARIYDPTFKVYGPPNDDEKTDSKKSDKETKKKKNTPIYLRDYERKMILEAEGKPVDEEGEEASGRIVEDFEVLVPYNEEQLRLKESFKPFLEDDDDEPLLSAKEKTSEEKNEEESTYLQWLKGRPDVSVDAEDAKELDPLRRYWNDPSLPEGERFLRDFVFNGTSAKVDEVKGASGEDLEVHDDVDLAADQDDVEKQADFERKFNFRFEEPDPDFVKSYPRTVADSLRRKDDTRARKREERKKHKQQEETERREEVRQLKRLKRDEITEKLQKLHQIAGGGSEGDLFGSFRLEDLDGDYDPEQHSKMLERVFNDQYYDVAEDVRPDIGLEEDDCQQYGDDIKAEAGSDWEEEGESKLPANQEEEAGPSTNTAGDADRPWRRKKSKAAMEIAKEKPVFNPEEKTFDDYLDEYYKLDYEDVVGGLPCRFKYRKVEPIDFGLDAKEVLKARDKELNSWVSIKRVVQYRRPEEDTKERRRFEQKAQNVHKKMKILPSLVESKEQDKKQKRQDNSNPPQQKDAKSKAAKSNKAAGKDPLSGFTDDRLRAYGLEPRKFKYTKHRFLQQESSFSDNNNGGGGGSKKGNKKFNKKPMKPRPTFA